MTDVFMGDCAKCPEIMHCQQAAYLLEEAAQVTTEGAMSELVDVLAKGLFDTIDKAHLGLLVDPISGEPVESAEGLASSFRIATAGEVDSYDQSRDEAIKEAEKLKKDCTGPLRMRAEKAGRIVTVTVCASPAKDIVGKDYSCEGVHVDRQPAPKVDGQY